jgi:AP-3 complex subunit beta
MEICPDRLDLLHPYYHHIVRLLVDADEWGQIVALQVLTIYARTMLDKPNTAGNLDPTSIPAQGKTNGDESEDEFEGLDGDLAMFLHLSKPLFQSRNPAVILGMANAYYHLAPANGIVGQQLLVAPLLHLAGASHVSERGEEIAALTWDVIVSMVEERQVSGSSRTELTSVVVCIASKTILCTRL